jgi:hypothetical protein
MVDLESVEGAQVFFDDGSENSKFISVTPPLPTGGSSAL